MDSLAELISAAQDILDGGFDVSAFLTWKGMAFLCLLSLLGPLHYYTRKFSQLTQEPDETSLLAAEGILWAAREEISNGRAQVKSRVKPPQSTPASGPFCPWISRSKKWHPFRSLLQEDPNNQ